MARTNRFPFTDLNSLLICCLVLTSFLFITLSTFTDYWLYEMASWTITMSPVKGVSSLKTTSMNNNTSELRKQLRSNSGLWNLCCAEGEWEFFYWIKLTGFSRVYHQIICFKFFFFLMVNLFNYHYISLQSIFVSWFIILLFFFRDLHREVQNTE